MRLIVDCRSRIKAVATSNCVSSSIDTTATTHNASKVIVKHFKSLQQFWKRTMNGFSIRKSKGCLVNYVLSTISVHLIETHDSLQVQRA